MVPRGRALCCADERSAGTEQDLEDAFAAFGEVSRASIIKDKFSGESRGFGFVEMPNKDILEADVRGGESPAVPCFYRGRPDGGRGERESIVI